MYRNLTIHTPTSKYGTSVRKNVKIETTKPVLFLAGPIRNAPKWQEEAIDILFQKNETVFVASPTRTLGKTLDGFTEVDKPQEYETFIRQRAWEQYYMYAAAKKGTIIFFLPKEAEVKEFPDKVYAHITMMELGLWIARCKMDKEINLVIGTDGNFPEWSTIEFEIKTEIPHVQIYDSLEKTIDAAIELCRKDILNLL
ncbi:MAG: hypothetical protein KA028_01430 [Candidatus Pacebacteria bacterium]|nr:hypothetical protein [Candidatus Paceibacterota bacterium]MBP9851775.1 hypothetical protein [Candidatus Paceibacterota bacterium]